MRSTSSAEHTVGQLSSEQLAAIDAIGAALFAGQPMRIGFNGLVSPKSSFVKQAEKEYQDGQSKGSRRPATRSRTRRQGPPRPRHPNAADLIRWALEDEVQVEELQTQYPEARVTARADGHWLAVRAYPLGSRGPRVLFLAAVPSKPVPCATWAFWDHLGEPAWLGPRHTNFGNGTGSVCAFPPESDHLVCDFPLLRYFDLLSEWAARHLYLAVHRKWPGPQEGRWRDYRLAETQPGECCPFPTCNSMRPYEDCCRPKDLLARAMGVAEAETYSPIKRIPPETIISLARRRGANPPRINDAIDA